MNFMKEGYECVFLIDSNILVYAYDKTDLRKHRIAEKLLEKCWNKELAYAISAQNLAEFFIIITKKVPFPLSIERAEQIVNDVISFSHWRILHYNQYTLKQGISLHKKSQKHFWDALIAATMINNGIFHIYTENAKDFEQFENITVVNPFEEKTTDNDEHDNEEKDI